MTRRPLIAGNWKMHKSPSEALAFAQELHAALPSPPLAVDAVVAPTFLALPLVAQALQDSPIAVSSQNVHPAEQGAFTGEVSAPMLRDAGCTYAIVGHSERRQIFGESDAFVHDKLQALLQHDLTPILCLGETLEEREAKHTQDRVRSQLMAALDGFSSDDIQRVVVAYEPIWAIGTGKTATPEQAQEIHHFLRQQLAERAGDAVAERARILYGGSVKPTNIESLLQQADIDGALIGGASLQVDSFVAIITLAQQLTQTS